MKMRNKNESAHYRKMTETPVGKLVLRMAVPTTVSMLIMNIYNMVDTAFVGRLGTSASGAVGIVFGFMTILQALGFTFGQGCGSIVSRELGAQNSEEASTVFSTAFFVAAALSLVVEGICFLRIDRIVTLLGSTPTIAPYAKTYITYILLAAPFTVCSFVMNNMLRFEGKALYGMIGMCAGAVLNMIGDPILMFGCGMGIAGAGLSTAISQCVGFFILLRAFLRGHSACSLSVRKVRLRFSGIMDICTTGLPSLLRQGLSSITTMLLNQQAAVYGDAAVAAMSICSRVCFFVFSFALGIGQGFQPVCAFNYGAKKKDRVRAAYRFTALFSQAVMLVAATVVFLNAERIVTVFRNDPEVIRIGTFALRLQVIAMLTQPFATVTEMSLQSTGQKLQASVLSSLKSGLFFIPILLILARVRGLRGIQEAQPLAYLLTVIPTLLFAVGFFRKLSKE